MSDVWSPPKAEVRDGGVVSAEAVEIRTKHINHEAGVKSIGTLYYLGAIGVIVAGFAGLFTGAVLFPGFGKDGMAGMIFAVFLLALGGLQFWLARGLRGLKSWARIPTGVLAVLGLLGFPFGTLINAYILYLLFSKKGNMVFSDEYQGVIAATPEIKAKTSIIVWIFLGLLVLLVAFAFILPAVSSHS